MSHGFRCSPSGWEAPEANGACTNSEKATPRARRGKTRAESGRIGTSLVRIAPPLATMGPMVRAQLERVEALELLGMTLAHLNDAEERAEMSPRLALLMVIRDKLAVGLREER